MRFIKKNRTTLDVFEEWKKRKKLEKTQLEKQFLNWETTVLKEKQKLIQAAEISWKKFTKLSATKKDSPKVIVKKHFLNEQGHLCSYCQMPLKENSGLDERHSSKSISTFEHLIARDTAPSKMFDLDNLFLCCDGGQTDNENRDKNLISYPEYCGKHKQNRLLSIHPLMPNCESFFEYYEDDKNEIWVAAVNDNALAQKAIDVLNLNVPKLRKLRGVVFQNLIGEPFELTKKEVKQLMVYLSKPQIIQEDKYFHPYCGVILKLLESYL